ncbi:glycerate kinase [Pontibacter sp. 172403-2]|uniref:glycerate kinase n=1 Tax=Pontibacter rufus TaxID=2791028 RepID=UPI0018AF9083|nr:glycerate kinase [Pontibacter sp. 172403-2]MBF9255700.1 glycerate kinase [Pontibacter sp. 172403-2]
MKIVVAPDSYKGSLSAKEVGIIIKEAFTQEIPGVQVHLVPMADGGEGTLDTLLFATHGRRIDTTATGPLGEPVTTSYGVLGDAETIVIEMALVAGLPMVPAVERNPMLTTTFGIGELILEAIQKGFRHFIIGLGGSATNDGGLGMLQALGAIFLDKYNQRVSPTGDSLLQVTSVDFSGLNPKLKECSFKIASDVESPLCGTNGATHVFGPQKGATAAQVILLDEGMAHYARLVEEALQLKLQHIPGAGAAGGLGFGFLALGAEILSGARIVAEAAGLKHLIKEADWVITGEGQSDYQTAYGKAPFFVASMAKEAGVNTILLSGSLGEGHEQLLEHFVSCHSILHAPVSLAEAMTNARIYLASAARNIARLLYHASQKSNLF